MKFLDEVKIYVRSGKGGNGCVSFRREKFIPRGGPNGGDGGDGGDVVFQADASNPTLIDLSFQRHVRAHNGTNGSGQERHGRRGGDVVVHVPVGTMVKHPETGEILSDLTRPGQRFVAAKGGRGGLGNCHFATSTNRAPRQSTPAGPGEERWLLIELRIMAEAGLVGFPNAGKSTLISRLSAAHPRIAPYPFTTLTPQLGTVIADDESRFVVAEIPGLIEGASEGFGLGHRFLRHVARTRALIHVVDLSPETGRDPADDYRKLNLELERYDPTLLEKPQLVAANKIDAVGSAERLKLLRAGVPRKVKVLPVSGLTGQGIPELNRAIAKMLASPAVRDGAGGPAA